MIPQFEELEPVQIEHPTSDEKVLTTPTNWPTRGRAWAAAAALILLLLTGLGMTEATGVTNVRGTVVHLFSPEGTLIVEVDDPGVSITIDGEEMVITGAGAKEIRLKPGQYKVLASRPAASVCGVGDADDAGVLIGSDAGVVRSSVHLFREFMSIGGASRRMQRSLRRCTSDSTAQTSQPASPYIEPTGQQPAQSFRRELLPSLPLPNRNHSGEVKSKSSKLLSRSSRS